MNQFVSFSVVVETRVKDYLGGEEYEFGSLTKKAVTNFTGKGDYEFGDVTKKLLGGMGKFLGNTNKPKGGNDKR